MRTQLPQEIVDAIIDQVAEDHERETLLALSLTSSIWLPRSQHHLFHDVHFKHRRNPISFEGNSTAANYAVKVTMDCRIFDVSCCPKLQNLVLKYIDFTTGAVEIPPCLSSTATELHVCCCRFQGFRGLARLLNTLPALINLEMDCNGFLPDKSVTTIPISPPLSSNLQINSTSPDTFESQLFALLPIANRFKSISIRVMVYYSVPPLNGLLKASGPNLQSLEISIITKEHRKPPLHTLLLSKTEQNMAAGDENNTISFSHNTNMTALALRIYVSPSDLFSKRIIPMLITTSSPLQKLTLGVLPPSTLSIENMSLDWESLDLVLQSRRFSSLSCVKIMRVPLSHAGGDPPMILKRGLARTISRGVALEYIP
jgi:hypothetical protein